ncbi:MAG: zinc ribbon domain-containing protein [Candidatus Sumerlaeaceae bacterium]|nr:zinc ribbon domain-containing protein [Candidatus Sumerlaeaceae bacterium]
MPTYEYKCTSCGKHFEYFQSISEPKKTTCEACGGALERLLSAGSGLIFKGSGFYITDYKGGDKGGAKGEPKSESKAEPKAEKPATETKPAESKPSAESKPASGTKSDS